MTSTIGAESSRAHPSQWHLLFAQEPDKDLDFDEGLEDDDLHDSKPPSRRPFLWIILVLLAIGIAYWTLNPNTSMMPESASTERSERATDTRQGPAAGMTPPAFQENQRVALSGATGDSMLMGDPLKKQPGPKVKSGETLVILDGSYQPTTGWVYQVRTQNGRTGWISGEQLVEKAS